ncbi:MAG: DUF4837 family protein [Lewinellaceae bacterium]|nr:DUF4837 family protein [Phaeodactylibacter sp.]MCB0615603.1 DUF4837 family protein [Phaeodactylibacter sp.]MCB9347865.1 DUF4837 family protein [Lewinellaceae bacterium]
MKKTVQAIIFAAALVAFSLQSCTESARRGLSPVPTAFGNLNEIVVIMDADMWDGAVGDTLRYYYSSAYPLLPQPEPIFDLRHFTPEDLKKDPLRKELRTYMIVGNLKDGNSPTTKMIINDIGEENARKAKEDKAYNSTLGRNKWGKGQLLIYEFGYSEDELIAILKENFPAVRKRVNEHDENKINAYVYLSGENKRLEEEIKQDLNVSIRLPGDYFQAINDNEIIWLRRETDETSSNIILKKIPYTDRSQLSKENIIAIRDSIGKQYISSTLPGTYMQSNGIDLPILTNVTKINGYYTLEARGIWEIVDDYMGGAFVSYLILNPNTNELLFVDGFLHAPGEDKRNLMQYIEHIIKTIKF